MHDHDSHKILIVEDESLIVWSMVNALGKAGYDSDVVECGEDAVDKFTAGGYDLVISDIRLPRMDGIDLAGKIKSLSSGTPVVIISGHEELEDRDVASSRTVDRCLEIPFNVNDLVDLVDQLLYPDHPRVGRPVLS
jgi:two-component system response regulator HydG